MFDWHFLCLQHLYETAPLKTCYLVITGIESDGKYLFCAFLTQICCFYALFHWFTAIPMPVRWLIQAVYLHSGWNNNIFDFGSQLLLIQCHVTDSMSVRLDPKPLRIQNFCRWQIKSAISGKAKIRRELSRKYSSFFLVRLENM